MARFAIWLVLCSVVVIRLRRRPDLTIIAALLLMLAVPSWDAGVLTGIPYISTHSGIPSVMPVTWFLLLAVLWRCVLDPFGLVESIRPAIGGVVMVSVAAFWAVVVTMTSPSGTAGLSQLLDSLIAPLSLIFISSLDIPSVGARRLQGFLLITGGIESALAITESLTGHALVYVQPTVASASQYGLTLGTFRSAGTLDNPLNLGLFLLVALGCCGVVRDARLRTVARLLLIVGIALSGSRAATLGAGLVLLLTASSSTSLAGAARGVLYLALAAVLLLVTPIGKLLRTRTSNDYGSTSIRVHAYSVFGHIVEHFLLWGNGVGSSFALAVSTTGTHDSFESPLIMWTVDIGLWATVVMLLGLLWCMVGTAVDWRLAVTACASFGVALSYSSFATRDSAGVILAIAIASVRASRAPLVSPPLTSTIPSDTLAPANQRHALAVELSPD